MKQFLEFSILKCSYIPTACQSNTDYLSYHFNQYFHQLFPNDNNYFECFTSYNRTNANESVAVMYLPDEVAYQAGLVMCYLGILTGLSMIIYGFKLKFSSN